MIYTRIEMYRAGNFTARRMLMNEGTIEEASEAFPDCQIIKVERC